MRIAPRPLLLVLCAALAVAGAPQACAYARGASFVVRAAGIEGWPRRAARWHARPFAEREMTVPSRHGPLRTRVYDAARGDRALVLVPGVHAAGIDEPRLQRFARDLAGAGLDVVTPELPDLARYRITPRTTDMIEDAARWSAGQHDLAPDGRVGLMGISFGGGLSLAAAGRPGLRERAAFIVSLGGHGDLARVLRYLCTGRLPDGTRFPPHDYGVVIILLNVADRLVPAAQVERLRAGIETFLQASHVDMIDKKRAATVFARARQMEGALAEPARTLLHEVNTRDVNALGERLLPHLQEMDRQPALSPERSPRPLAPVFLLHGAGDNVIPAAESALLARHLRPSDDGPPVRLLISPLITHAEVDRAAAAVEVVKLVRFWKEVLSR